MFLVTMESPPVLRINVFSKQIKKPKYFKAMELFYKFLHIICLLDFGFFEFKSYKQRIFWKSITTTQFMIYCGMVLNMDYQNQTALFINHSILLFSYFINVLLLVLIKPSKTFCKLFLDLELIDYELQINNASYNLGIKICTITFLHLCFKFLSTFFYAYRASRMLFYNEFSYFCIMTVLHTVLVSYSFVFYSIYCRLKGLVSVLRTVDSDFSLLQLIYKRIVELTEVHKTAFDPIFILALLINIPQVMGTLLEAVQRYFDKNIAETGMLYEFILAAQYLMILFAPAICASMLSTQADMMKIVLFDKLLQVRDIYRVREIERFIGYVEARGLRYRVWKVIPLDADLPGIVLSFCVTYLIVIVQFNNK